MAPDLVYDIGVHNGDDTAYYLWRGFRVVAVDADPTLIEQVRARFPEQTRSGQLTLVNAAVGEATGEADFFLCPEASIWNSFSPEAAERRGLKVQPIRVQVVRFSDLLARHTVPFYLKIDIEGFDHLCLRDIDPADRPVHVSWEMDRVEDVFLMKEKGYNAFRCVSQSRLEVFTPGDRRGSVLEPRSATLRRDLRAWMVRRAPWLLSASRMIRGARPAPAPEGTQDEGGLIIRRLSVDGREWAFRFSSSGPFGDDLGGAWCSPEEVVYRYLDYWLNTGLHAELSVRDWFDIHCTRIEGPDAPRFIGSHAV